jgi:hypothetical protein
MSAAAHGIFEHAQERSHAWHDEHEIIVPEEVRVLLDITWV